MSLTESWRKSYTAWQAETSAGSSMASQLQAAWTIVYFSGTTSADNSVNNPKSGEKISPEELDLLGMVSVNPAALSSGQKLQVELIIRVHFPKPLCISIPAVATVDAIGTETTARITFKTLVTGWLSVAVPRSDFPPGTQEGDSLAVEIELDAEDHFQRCVSYQPVSAKALAAHPGLPPRPANADPAAWAEYRRQMAVFFGEE